LIDWLVVQKAKPSVCAPSRHTVLHQVRQEQQQILPNAPLLNIRSRQKKHQKFTCEEQRKAHENEALGDRHHFKWIATIFFQVQLSF